MGWGGVWSHVYADVYLCPLLVKIVLCSTAVGGLLSSCYWAWPSERVLRCGGLCRSPAPEITEEHELNESIQNGEPSGNLNAESQRRESKRLPNWGPKADSESPSMEWC